MNADIRLRCISKDGIGLQYLWMGFREALASRSLPVGVAPMGQLPLGVGSGWPSGLRRCAQAGEQSSV